MTLVAQHLIKPIGKGYFVATLVCQYGTHVTHEVTQAYKRSVNNMWIILTILLAITCMWLIKVNKDSVRTNEGLLNRLVDSLHDYVMLEKDIRNKEDNE